MKTRVTREDCERVKRLIDPLTEHDSILTEEDLEKRARDKGYTSNVKFPDCLWHYKRCDYVVVEIKGGNFMRAYRQLEVFANYFPEIHSRVSRYVIILDSTKHLGDVACLHGSIETECRAARRLGGRQKLKPLDVGGKPLYIRKHRSGKRRRR